MRVRRADTFIADLAKEYSYIFIRNQRAADRLLDRIDLLASMLGHFPDLGRSRPGLGVNIRSFPLRGFAYLVFYQVNSDEVLLMRLWHSARRVSRKRLAG